MTHKEITDFAFEMANNRHNLLTYDPHGAEIGDPGFDGAFEFTAQTEGLEDLADSIQGSDLSMAYLRGCYSRAVRNCEAHGANSACRVCDPIGCISKREEK